MRLQDLAELCRMSPAGLRERVPFGDSWLAKEAGCSVKALRARLTNPVGDAVDRQVARVLLKWVYEGSLDEGLPLVYSFKTLPVDKSDDGGRIGILCPLCNAEFMLGSVEPFVMVPTDREDRKLIFYHGAYVQCPRAQAGSCLAPKESWKPRLVRYAYRPGPGAALDRSLLEVPDVQRSP